MRKRTHKHAQITADITQHYLREGYTLNAKGVLTKFRTPSPTAPGVLAKDGVYEFRILLNGLSIKKQRRWLPTGQPKTQNWFTMFSAYLKDVEVRDGRIVAKKSIQGSATGGAL